MFAGCALPKTRQASIITPVQEQDVKQCQYVGEFTGGSLVGGMMQKTGLENAKTEILEKASKVHATHIVWSTQDSSMMGAQAKAKAYQCTSFHDSNFSFKAPDLENWEQVPTSEGKGYGFCRKPGKELKLQQTLCAEVSLGFLNLGLKAAEEVLELFKQGKINQSKSARFESLENKFDKTTFKGAQCLNFFQLARDRNLKDNTGEPMLFLLRGRTCVHPDDFRNYIDVSVSQRYSKDQKPANSKSDEDLLFNGVQFRSLK